MSQLYVPPVPAFAEGERVNRWFLKLFSHNALARIAGSQSRLRRDQNPAKRLCDTAWESKGDVTTLMLSEPRRLTAHDMCAGIWMGYRCEIGLSNGYQGWQDHRDPALLRLHSYNKLPKRHAQRIRPIYGRLDRAYILKITDSLSNHFLQNTRLSAARIEFDRSATIT